MKHLKTLSFIAVMIAVITAAYIFEPRNQADINKSDLAVLQNLADSGDRKGQLMLGLAYQSGEYGLKPDAVMADKWIGLAAKNGSEYAQTLMKSKNQPPPVITFERHQKTVIDVVWGHYRNLILFSISIVLLAGYHIVVYVRTRKDPSYSTFQTITTQARSAWVRSIMSHDNFEVLAVQTLRNSTMAATFLASTAILLIIGVLNISHFGTVSDAIAVSSQHSALHAFKVGPLLFTLFTAFFMFTLSVRMFNHVGYLVNCKSPYIDSDYVSRVLNRGGAYYSLGMRSYYLSIPFVCWLFNPLLMLVSSIMLLFVLHHIDHVYIED